jgi:hypothetical protein
MIGTAMLKRIALILAICVVAAALTVVGIYVHMFYTLRGPLNSSGDQPPTACTVQTAQRDCRKLKCTSHVWYCETHGTPQCLEGRCMCFYGCL